MPATCTELQLSRRLTYRKSAEFLYLIEGTTDEAAAMTALLAAAATYYTFPAIGSGEADAVLPRQPPEIEPLHITASDGRWQGRVQYQARTGSQEAPTEIDSSFSFDTTGGTEKITVSKQTVGIYGVGGVGGPAIGGLIGYDGNQVQGCERTVPIYKWTETHYKKPADVDATYKGKLFHSTGTVNNAAFRNFAAGEVLFLGVSGARRGDDANDLWELTFHFAAQPNQVNITIGNVPVAAKGGWEYLWVFYEETVDPQFTVKCMVAKFVYVERIYEDGDFDTMDID